MGIPQVIILVLMSIGLLFAANEHGKTESRKGNFFKTLVSTSIMAALLYWGGFFN